MIGRKIISGIVSMYIHFQQGKTGFKRPEQEDYMNPKGFLRIGYAALLFIAVFALICTACPGPEGGNSNYTVTFDGNGATGGAAPAPQTVGAGSPITMPSRGTLSKTGFVFGGWNTKADGSGTTYAVNDSYTPTSSITLFAKWDLPDSGTWKVTYDANGATGGNAPAAQDVAKGSDLTLASGGGLSMTGHTFSGWNTLADGEGITYAAGSSFTPDDNVTLYAKWLPAKYTVDFNPNNGNWSGSTADQTAEADYNATVTLPANPARTGFVFEGWNTMADGTGTAFTALTPVVGNITVYANWSIDTAHPIYSISLSRTDPYDFPLLLEGYAARQTFDLVITNTGNMATGALTVNFTGTDAASFEYSGSVSSIAFGGTTTLTLQPKMGLLDGAYAATLNISGGNGITGSIDVSVTVKAVPSIGITAVPNPYSAATNPTGNSTGAMWTSVTPELLVFPDFPYVSGGGAPTREPLWECCIIISNTGSKSTGPLNVAYIGGDAASFQFNNATQTELNTLASASGDIPVGGQTSALVLRPINSPRLGLGTYNTTLVVATGQTTIASINIRLTVRDPSGNAALAYYWINEQDQIAIAGGPTTLSKADGNSLAITAAGEGYTNQHWYVNGVEDTEKAGSLIYTFSASDKAVKTYNIGLRVEKDGKFYYTEFAVTVTE